MNPIAIATIVAFSMSVPALAQQTEHPLGEHPAVIAKRMSEHQAYDYSAKFHPHPAWLYLSSVPPQQAPGTAIAQRSDPKEPKPLAKVQSSAAGASEPTADRE